MVAGLLVGGAAIAAAVIGVGAIGLGIAAAHRVGSAYGRTVEQMYEQQSMVDYYNQQKMADYYNQQAYYSSSGRSHHRHQPSGYHQSGYSYGYR